MKSVKQIWQETAKQLEKVYDQRESEQISYLLLEDVFGHNRASILANDRCDIDEKKLKELIDRLHNHEPIQYVTGVADFYGRRFHIAPGALIPRPETEELCELIIMENEVVNPKILDVGVGSGCIAITLALELSGDTFGTDVSEEALRIANQNAQKLGAEISFMKHDILNEELQVSELDILVSNPPYIPQLDKKEMRENVLSFEPQLALFIPDDDPIVFYRRITDVGLKSLKKGGKVYFEIHEKHGKKVTMYLEESGYSDVKIHRDMQGKERMVSGVND